MKLFYRRSTRPPKSQEATAIAEMRQVISTDKTRASRALVDRIANVYRKAFGETVSEIETSPDVASIWKTIFSKNADVHTALIEGADVSHMLDNPASTSMFYGFENLCRELAGPAYSTDGIALVHLVQRLAQAVGAARIPNPEQPQNNRPVLPTEALLDAISQRLGAEIDFPNPFPGELGLPTTRGIASYRALQAIYQASRIKMFCERFGSRIIEIGAGLGRTAYYCYKLGLTDYTIVDLPFTNISQANFLSRVLPEGAISLFGEARRGDQINILPAASFPGLTCDVLADIDSLTEMSLAAMQAYTKGVGSTSKVFWSVNHGLNATAVDELDTLKGRLLYRAPCWMRDGYVEELYV